MIDDAALEEFKKRLINWGRVYKPHYKRLESNLMPVIRLKKGAGGAEDEIYTESPNEKDAALIDACISKWRRSGIGREACKKIEKCFRLIYVEYIFRFTSETFETEKDGRRQLLMRSRFAHVQPGRNFSNYMSEVKKAETQLFVFFLQQESKNRLTEKIRYL